MLYRAPAWLLVSMVAVHLVVTGVAEASHLPASAPEVRNVAVLRVHFADEPAESRWSREEVRGMMEDMSRLWENTSYGAMRLNPVVSDLYRIAGARDRYMTVDGNRSSTDEWQMFRLMTDAIGAAPAGSLPSPIHGVLVVAASTDASPRHRAVGWPDCTYETWPTRTDASWGCAFASENPTDSRNAVWGAWMHELGHAFQSREPWHPSNYDNEFELMDSRYPGHVGPFSKIAGSPFGAWMPGAKMETITRESGGGAVALWSIERDLHDGPNLQAAKVEVTRSLYYVVSAREPVRGDEIAGMDAPGVLIERVSEGSDPWVTVMSPGGDPFTLWQRGQSFSSDADGVTISIGQNAEDPRAWWVHAGYAPGASQPDVALAPWASPPGNTWESTDIWVDSPLNGWGTFRYGTWSDGAGGVVPQGNGDDPAIGHANRVYARVRNVGTAPATDVVVTIERADPAGLGILPSSAWTALGTLDRDDFPGLASIPPGGHADVFVEWTPSVPVTDADRDAGRIAFHTCLRVVVAPVAGETVLGNQDGEREQENVQTFQVPVGVALPERHAATIRLANHGAAPRTFVLAAREDLPDGWKLRVNDGAPVFDIGPGETRDVPVEIAPGDATGLAPGGAFGVDVAAFSRRELASPRDPEDVHLEHARLGGVRVEARVVSPAEVSCSAERQSGARVRVHGALATDAAWLGKDRAPVAVELARADGAPVASTLALSAVADDGSFAATLDAQGEAGAATHALCLFAGTRWVQAAGGPLAAIEPVEGSAGAGGQITQVVPGPGVPLLGAAGALLALARRRER